jgi:hypothetical protein
VSGAAAGAGRGFAVAGVLALVLALMSVATMSKTPASEQALNHMHMH